METEQIKTLIRRVFFTERLSYNIREIGNEEYLVEVSIKGEYFLLYISQDRVDIFTHNRSFVVEDPIEQEKTNPCAFELTEIY